MPKDLVCLVYSFALVSGTAADNNQTKLLFAWKAQLGKNLLHSQSHWQDTAPIGLLAWALPHVLSMDSIRQLTACLRVKKWANRRGQVRQKPESFCNLISELTSHHICHTLFVRSKSPISTHIQRAEDYIGMWIQEGGNHWGHPRSCLPHNN